MRGEVPPTSPQRHMDKYTYVFSHLTYVGRDLTALSKIASLPKRICTRRRQAFVVLVFAASRRYLGALVIIFIYYSMYYVFLYQSLFQILDCSLNLADQRWKESALPRHDCAAKKKFEVRSSKPGKNKDSDVRPGLYDQPASQPTRTAPPCE